jgi:antiviral helicase SKI2
MGMNELLITELVLRNILTKLQPAEVAALLSALVFSPKRDNKDEELVQITEDLTKVWFVLFFFMIVKTLF